MSTVNVKAFTAVAGTTREIDVTATSQRFALPTRNTANTSSGYTAVRVSNNGTKVFFVAFGDVTVTAVAPDDATPDILGDVAVLPSSSVILEPSGSYIAVVCSATETSTAYVSAGYGG